MTSLAVFTDVSSRCQPNPGLSFTSRTIPLVSPRGRDGSELIISIQQISSCKYLEICRHISTIVGWSKWVISSIVPPVPIFEFPRSSRIIPNPRILSKVYHDWLIWWISSSSFLIKARGLLYHSPLRGLEVFSCSIKKLTVWIPSQTTIGCLRLIPRMTSHPHVRTRNSFPEICCWMSMAEYSSKEEASFSWSSSIVCISIHTPFPWAASSGFTTRGKVGRTFSASIFLEYSSFFTISVFAIGYPSFSRTLCVIFLSSATFIPTREFFVVTELLNKSVFPPYESV